jgi:hypothetical protein
MTTWIAWPPHTSDSAFPADFRQDPLDQYHHPTDSESCPVCSFRVPWAQHESDFVPYNEDTRRRIREQLDLQVARGECPTHPIPSGWT